MDLDRWCRSLSSQSSQSAVPNQSSQCPPSSPPPCSSSSSSMSSSSSSSSLLGLETVQPQPPPPPPPQQQQPQQPQQQQQQPQQQGMMGGPECLHGESKSTSTWSIWGQILQTFHLVASFLHQLTHPDVHEAVHAEALMCSGSNDDTDSRYVTLTNLFSNNHSRIFSNYIFW